MRSQNHDTVQRKLISPMVVLILLWLSANVQSFAAMKMKPSSAVTGRKLAFVARHPPLDTGRLQQSSSSRLMASFAADGSEYSSKDQEYEDDTDINDYSALKGLSGTEEDSTPTIELQPVPMSKNSGNRFVAIVWDQDVDIQGRDARELHDDRHDALEDHVMFCRKRNLYNETFNTDSMVDILWSLPILASDLQRIVGHVLVMESTAVNYVQECLQEEPILQTLSNGDLSNVQLYRWRHIRDYTLRIDDGRDGYPCMAIAMDDASELGSKDVKTLRSSLEKENMEYWIRSERVIAAGPMYMSTEFKDDPSSIAVGDLILFNAKNREDAISFVEGMPYAEAGLYSDLRVHFYNSLDVTGKFISEDPLRDTPCAEMKEAMEIWGYPVDDEQTPWLNW